MTDPTNPADFYIAEFPSRPKQDQDLDVAAPGSWVLGPYQINSDQISYYFLGGTSMASPHVSGIVALMTEKNPALTAGQSELILESSAIPFPDGCRDIYGPNGDSTKVCWDANATGAGLVIADAALAATP